MFLFLLATLASAAPLPVLHNVSPSSSLDWCIKADGAVPHVPATLARCDDEKVTPERYQSIQFRNFAYAGGEMKTFSEEFCLVPSELVNGAAVHSGECGAGNWSRTDYHALRWAESNLCLDNKDGEYENGNPIIVSECQDGFTNSHMFNTKIVWQA